MPQPKEDSSQKDRIAALIQAQDWASSPLGPPSSWPDELHTIVKLMLDSRFPMFVAWGPELGLLYNEAYIQFLGNKHPTALGRRLAEVWREVWTELRSLVDNALAGQALFVEDLPLVIERNGRAEQTWFTFSYSPVRNAENNVAGMYCVVTETTARVLAERRQCFQLKMADTLRVLSDPLDITAAASRLIGEYFHVARVGYGEILPDQQYVNVARDWTDGTITSLAGASKPLESFGPAFVSALKCGKTVKVDDIAADPRSFLYVAGYAGLGIQSMVSIPLLEDGRLTAVLYLHEPHPRNWTTEEVAFAEDVARRTWEAVKRARAEEALRDETRVLELLNRTGQVVASTLDLQTLLQSITDTATQLSKAEFGAFFYTMTNQHGESLMLYTLSGAPREAFEKFGHPRATALFGPTFKGEAPIRSADITKDARYGHSDPYKGMPPGHLPVRSYLAVPVITRTGEVIGGLFFGHPATGVFTERTERIIVGVAAQAAMAIDNARLYAQAQMAAEEREALLTSERAARAEAERMSRMKDEFLAMLAHELRNPLAPIGNAAELLTLRASTEPWVTHAGTIIKRQVAQMRHLLDDLLDVSRVTHGLVAIAKRRIDLKTVVTEALDQVRAVVEEKHHRLSIQLPSEPVYVEGDYFRLTQTVANILNNAAKYTPAAGDIKLRLGRSDNGLVEISVIDNGIGIAPDLLPNVFELFTQGKRTLARSQGGIGLGLTLVKKLVELHGGTVAAYSAGVGQGSEFVIHLPIPELDHQAVNNSGIEALSIAALPLQQQGGMLRIMVVDDNQDAADTLSRLLTCNGHAVLTAYTAETALALAEREVPDVFLLDIGLPDLDGYELARQLRLRPSLAQSMLVAVTGYGQPEDRQRTSAAGFSHHLVKPADLVRLWTLLEEAVSSKNMAIK
jgi:signal transduction histidine kinase/ActR/RegA family two-component response regulator